ncbi:MAG: sigma 54-interacting transcriptional regulator, partial [Planctomycetota bacterium]|nr:sigma 54-interacting transcriptional regulator [Planctomycetota bacterium]
MIKLTVIIPYPEIRERAENILAAQARPGVECEIIHAYGTAVDGLRLDRADIILARGLTQQALKRRYGDAAVLEFKVSAYDIIRALQACVHAHASDRVAIIAADSVLHDVESLKEIVNVDLKFFRIRDEAGILTALAEAERDGFGAVVGGLTACTLARERGWRTSVIRTSDETVQVSILEAMNTAAVIQNERAKAEIFRAILRNSREAILFFNPDGRLAVFNPRAREILNLPPAENLDGLTAAELLGDPEITAIIRERRERRALVKEVNQALVVCGFAPVRLAEQDIGVICTFQRAHEIQAAEHRIRKELNKKGLVAKYRFADIVHASPVLSQVIATAGKYSSVDANILLTGETGTGKELFAQSIHNASRRSRQPFVAVNCAAFPANLLESELFGYVGGAFSGAAKGGKTGLFELAHGGTLFLDEIGEMPLDLQAVLLRALQEGEIRRIGDDRLIPVDVRIIAASNKELRERAAAGRFRLDLLYRLDVLSLAIPPLRERLNDVGRLIEHFLRLFCREYGKIGLRLSSGALETLKSHNWPGNIRELRNICERLTVLGLNDEEITKEQVDRFLPVTSLSNEASRPAAMLPPV